MSQKTEHRDGFIRDAFTNGIFSHGIHQRLLEESTPTIDAFKNLARRILHRITLNRLFVQALTTPGLGLHKQLVTQPSKTTTLLIMQLGNIECKLEGF